MIQEIKIEQATLADLDAIVETENLCFQADAYTRKQFAYLIAKAKGVFYVIRSAGKVLAYISLLSNARTRNLRIYSLAVRPEARGHRLGLLLMEECIRYATHTKLKAVTLEVNVSNATAISLYEKFGFVKATLIRNYYHDGSDAFGMKRMIEQTGVQLEQSKKSLNNSGKEKKD